MWIWNHTRAPALACTHAWRHTHTHIQSQVQCCRIFLRSSLPTWKLPELPRAPKMAMSMLSRPPQAPWGGQRLPHSVPGMSQRKPIHSLLCSFSGSWICEDVSSRRMTDMILFMYSVDLKDAALSTTAYTHISRKAFFLLHLKPGCEMSRWVNRNVQWSYYVFTFSLFIWGAKIDLQ